jgi:hypothetical protein
MRVSEPSCAGNAYRVGGVRLRRGREQCGLPVDRLPARNNHRTSVMGASVQRFPAMCYRWGEAQKRAGGAHERRPCVGSEPQRVHRATRRHVHSVIRVWSWRSKLSRPRVAWPRAPFRAGRERPPCDPAPGSRQAAPTCHRSRHIRAAAPPLDPSRRHAHKGSCRSSRFVARGTS